MVVYETAVNNSLVFRFKDTTILLFKIRKEKGKDKMKKFTNQEILTCVADYITSQKRLNKNDKEFLETFYQKENDGYIPLSSGEIKGIILDEPQYKNLFINVFYNRFIRLGVIETLNNTNIFDFFNKGEMELGAGWSRVMNDIFNVKDYSKDASPLTKGQKGRTVEVFSDFPHRKMVDLIIFEDELKLAFNSSDFGLSEFVANKIGKIRKTLMLHLEDRIRTELKATSSANAKTPGTNNSIKLAPFVDVVVRKMADGYIIPTTDVIDGATLSDFSNSGNVQTATDFKLYLANLAMGLTKPSRAYNLGDTDGGLMANIGLGDGIIMLDSNIMNAMNLANDMLFNNDSNLRKYFSDIIPLVDIGNLNDIERVGDGINSDGIPQEKITENDRYKPIAYVIDKNIFEYKIFLDKMLDFYNPAALYTNYFSHFWFATLNNPYVVGVRVLLDLEDQGSY